MAKYQKKNVGANDSLYTNLWKKVEQAEGDSEVWRNKQDRLHRLRMMIKKEKNFPFVGCSNMRMPTAETKIRKQKAALAQLIFGIRPIVNAIPAPSGNFQTAKKIEKFLDHIIMNVMKFRNKAILAIDRELEQGFSILKPYWRVETTKRIEKFKLEDMEIDELLAFFDPDRMDEERVEALAAETEADRSDRVWDYNEKQIRKAVEDAINGEDEIAIMLKDVLYDAPDAEVVPAENFVAPTDGGFDVQTLEFCGPYFYKPLHELKQNADDRGYDIEVLDELKALKDASKQTIAMATKEQREGISRLNNPSELVKVLELCCWYDIDGDGEVEKCLFTLLPDFKKCLRKISLPNDNGKWPFVKLFWELTEDRWYSHRGIVEIAEDIIKEIDIQHMQKLDQQTIRNAPMFLYRAGMVNPNLVQFIPNQGIPIHGMGDLNNTLTMLNHNNPNVEMSYEREEQILLSRIEELIGQVDFTLQSQINRREPRTLGEVQFQMQNQQTVFALDASIHVEQFSEFFAMIFDLWCQYGPDEYEFEYFGERKWEKIKLTREEIQGKYRITVRGNDQNTNPQVRLQKAQAILTAATNPVLLQTGVVSPQHIAQALRLFYNELDVEDAENYYNAQPMPQPQGPQMSQPQFSDMTDGEKAQVLAQMGINPDIRGRQLNTMREIANERAEKQGRGTSK